MNIDYLRYKSFEFFFTILWKHSFILEDRQYKNTTASSITPQNIHPQWLKYGTPAADIARPGYQPTNGPIP